jgi:hypothetical protein
VKIAPASAAASPTPSIKTAAPTAPADVADAVEDPLTGTLAIAATVAALAAVGIQVWMFL